MNRRTYKVKKAMLIAAIMLMMALVVGMGAVTYSRYVTSKTVSDQTANAAQWGFSVMADTSGLFGTDYSLDPSDTFATITESGVAVKAASSANVVAPGTTGSMSIEISGKSEVLAKLVFSVDAGTTDIYLGTYYPIKWIVKSGAVQINADTSLTGALSALKDDVLSIKSGGVIPIGEEISKSYTVTWEWEFTGGNDTADTVIGLLSAGKTVSEINAVYGAGTAEADKYSTSIYFGFTVGIEQIQSAS